MAEEVAFIENLFEECRMQSIRAAIVLTLSESSEVKTIPSETVGLRSSQS